MIRLILLLMVSLVTNQVFSQGQDSQASERDLLVIKQMLSGVYDNASQAYFDVRRGLDDALRHDRLTVTIKRHGEENNFVLDLENNADSDAGATYLLKLTHDQANDRVLMSLVKKQSENAQCEYRWRRGPEHFSATTLADCGVRFPEKLELSKQHLWLRNSSDSPKDSFTLHRTRPFTCYADMPGVGGGRSTPYQRYEGLELHDRGGSVWFDTKEEPSRKLGISLMLVDWPINNYKGAFARDSLVVYVSEKQGDSSKEHGYSFTVPEADRIGINLKWILVNCYMTSPAEVVPEM